MKRLEPIEDVSQFEWLTEKEERILLRDKTGTKMGFALHSLGRNLRVLRKSREILKNYDIDVVYTPSSVLDFVFFLSI